MNAKYAKQVKIYKNKPRISYPLITPLISFCPWVVPKSVPHCLRKFPQSGVGGGGDRLNNVLNLYRISGEGRIVNLAHGGYVWWPKTAIDFFNKLC